MPKLVKNCFNPHIGDMPFGEESDSINIQEIAIAIVFGNIFGRLSQCHFLHERVMMPPLTVPSG